MSRLSMLSATRTSGWRARNRGSIGASGPAAKVKPTLTRGVPRGTPTSPAGAFSASPTSSRMRRAWRWSRRPASVGRRCRAEGTAKLLGLWPRSIS